MCFEACAMKNMQCNKVNPVDNKFIYHKYVYKFSTDNAVLKYRMTCVFSIVDFKKIKHQAFQSDICLLPLEFITN